VGVISRIEIENFKSLKKLELQLGGLNLFTGTNSSGKSNFFDALRVLQGIGYGFTIEEIFNGKPKSARSDVWEPIRGGSARALFAERGERKPKLWRTTLQFSVTLEPQEGDEVISYSIGLSPAQGAVCSERLAIGSKPVFDSAGIDNPSRGPSFKVKYYRGLPGRQPQLQFEKSKPALHQILGEDLTVPHLQAVRACIEELSDVQRLDLSPAVLRDYSQARTVKRMGERGENFAALVAAILGAEESKSPKSAYLSWLRQLTPAELDDVTVLHGALGEPLFALKEGKEIFPAPILSDGTLRFAAITAAFFQPDLPGILTIEEIENGIHPSRLRLLVELLKSQSSTAGPQVMATTHSPVVLAWLEESDYATTFVCKRDEETGASIIKPLSEVPGFLELARKQSAGDLFAEGWMEGVL
jgi:predicted ATPase